MEKYLAGILFTGISLPKKAFGQLLRWLKEHAYTLTVLLLLIVVPLTLRALIWVSMENETPGAQPDELQLATARTKTEKEITRLDKKLTALSPKSYYLIINSASNEFSLYKGQDTVKEGKCSTGSYVLLKNGDNQQWMFKTPKGEFRIQGKTKSPVWKKPDWAFVEEGLPVPSANHHTRFEYGVLGDYALSLGKGYLIHGTLYQRFLGLPVTHGCIRLNDENLELVYRSLQEGSKVYIF